MKWSLILYLPAVISIVWALAIALTKRHLTNAQILFCLSLVVNAFTITVAGVYFRTQTGRLFFYDYLLELSTITCLPMYYIAICALTGPRGATLKQRRVFLVPLLFAIGLTIGAFGIHPSRYQAMCQHVFENGRIPWIPGDSSYNFMILWNQIVFPAVTVIMGIVLLLESGRKVRVYKERFNTCYANGLNMPKLHVREIVIVTWAFLPFIMLTIFLIVFRPYLYKYWLIFCALLLSLIQYLTGHFAYRYDHDARFLAEYIRNKESINS